MSEAYKIEDVFHRIRAKLYQVNLKHIEGEYIARTENEAALSIQQVCALIKNRTKYDGDYGELVQCVQRYFDEAAYQLCNGFSINTGYFRIQPNIGGHFKSPTEPFNPDKHHITMRFYPLAKLRRLIRDIKVIILGEANVTGFIGEVTDSYTGAVNDTVSGLKRW